MKANRIATLSAWSIVVALFLSSCGPAPTKGRMVEMTCDQEISLLNYANFEVAAPHADGRFVVYLSGPSLLVVDDDFPFLYLPEDGNRIDLRIDGDLLYVNGIVRSVSLQVSTPSNFAAWYASADEAALKSIRIIGSDDSFEAEIEAIVAVNPNIGICTEGKVTEGLFVSMDVSSKKDFVITHVDLSETKILNLEDVDPKSWEVFSDNPMPNLYRLILPAEPGADKLLDLFPHAKAVTFSDGNHVPRVDKLQNLEELHFLCDSTNRPIDLGPLQKLRILSILGEVNVTGLEKLTKLEYLNPGEIELSDENLATILSNHPNLVFLNLLYATVESLAPLRKATHLEGLVLNGFRENSDPDFTPLGALKKLRYIGLSKELEEQSEVVAEIKKVCPQVVVYRYDKFCLGSGWLVLFLPLLAFLLIFKRSRVKKREGVR